MTTPIETTYIRDETQADRIITSAGCIVAQIITDGVPVAVASASTERDAADIARASAAANPGHRFGVFILHRDYCAPVADNPQPTHGEPT